MFEAQFVKMMMGEMRRTLGKGSLIDGGFGEEMFTDVLDQERADVIVKGRGIGIGRMLEAQLTNKTYRRPIQFKMPEPEPAAAESEERTSAVAAETPRPQPLAAEPEEQPARQSQTGSLLWNRINALAEQARGQTRPAQEAAYVWPVEGDISSAFGARLHPILKTVRPHQGIDLKAAYGTPIQAAASGTVIFAGERGELGRTIIVEHSDRSRAIYGHCSRLLAREGQEVLQGQSIAKVGSSGLATGPHLHFEIRDSAGQALDPRLSLASPERESA
jgi:murein DD-endopeptidase MepM/ murein hydrolase activator NlpD